MVKQIIFDTSFNHTYSYEQLYENMGSRKSNKLPESPSLRI